MRTPPFPHTLTVSTWFPQGCMGCVPGGQAVDYSDSGCRRGLPGCDCSQQNKS